MEECSDLVFYIEREDKETEIFANIILVKELGFRRAKVNFLLARV